MSVPCSTRHDVNWDDKDWRCKDCGMIFLPIPMPQVEWFEWMKLNFNLAEPLKES